MNRPTLELIPDLPKDKQLDVLAEMIAAYNELGGDQRQPVYTRLRAVRLSERKTDGICQNSAGHNACPPTCD